MNRLLCLVCIGLSATTALAQDHGEADAADHAADAAAGGHASVGVMDFSWIQFASTLLAFGIVFMVLSKVAWPKILQGLEDREQKIRSEVFAAEEARKKADESLKEYEGSLAKAKALATEMIEQTKAEQMRLAAELRSKAEVELGQMRDAARRNIEAAKHAALNEIYNEAASLATSVASKILQREVNEEDQKRLVEESVEEFASEYAAN